MNKYKVIKRLCWVMFLLAFVSQVNAQTYKNQWKQIDSLLLKKLPKPAFKAMDKLYLKAKQENNAGQLVKAIIYKLKYTVMAEETDLAKSLKSLQAEVKTAKFPVKPMLHSLLGHIYQEYYYRHAWTGINNKTFVATDLRTWNLDQLINETIRQFKLSIEIPEKLRKIKIDIYDQVLIKGDKEQRRLRPTLYDFLAHKALSFFSNTSKPVVMLSNEIEMNTPEYLQDAKTFVQINVESSDTLSDRYNNLIILQRLLRFHQNDADPSALIDADLYRLQFVYERMMLPNKDALYLKALKRLEKMSGKLPVHADVLYALAVFHNKKGHGYNPLRSDKNKWRFKKAYGLCQQAIERFPKSKGAQYCRELQNAILDKSIKLQVEQVNVPNRPFVTSIFYRNVTRLHWRIYKIGRRWMSKTYRYCGKQKNSERCFLEQAFRRKPVHSWQTKLPNDKDYQPHRAEAKIPALPVGSYMLVASVSAGFETTGNAIVTSFVTVSNISYIHRYIGKVAQVEVFNRTTGKPLQGVKVERKVTRKNAGKNEYLITKGQKYMSDKNGFLTIPDPPKATHLHRFWLEFVKGKDQISTLPLEDYKYMGRYALGNLSRGWRSKSYEKGVRTFFFLDRKIYRPGQRVYFKGIVMEQQGKRPVIKPNYSDKIYLLNTNEDEIDSLSVTTNQYGTYHGSFVLPKEGLNGTMMLEALEGYDDIEFKVEDYKRPKFEVKLNPVKQGYKLNDTITVTGKAVAYSGANIVGGKVSYRVTREARFPDWYAYHYGYSPSSPSTQITNTIVTTNARGAFEIKFKAVPDPKIGRQEKPIFTYKIDVYVIDLNGETNDMSTTVPIGYHSLNIGIDVAKTIDKTQQTTWKISTKNLSGQFQAAVGKVGVYQLKVPPNTFRTRLWSQPDKFIYHAKEWQKWFPHDLRKNENNRYGWARGKKVFEVDFATKEKDKGSQIIEALGLDKWQAGHYVLEMKARDKAGKEVKAVYYFMLYNPQAQQIADNSVLMFKVLNPVVEPNKKVQILLGTASNNLWVLFEVEHNSQIVEQRWIELKQSQQIIEVPVKEIYRGNFAVHCTAVKNNCLYQYDKTIMVPYLNKVLDISFETFRNKLKPGEKEEWRMRIKGHKGEKIAAEMLATMYDASLDKLEANSFDLDIYKSFSQQLEWKSKEGFNIAWFSVFSPNWNKAGVVIKNKEYDELNLFEYRYGQTNYAPPVKLYRRKTLGIGRHIKGKVVDIEGNRLVGMNVMVKGTLVGAPTDLKGRFSFSTTQVYYGDVLIVSGVGFETQEVEVKNYSKFVIRMKELENVTGLVVVSASRVESPLPIMIRGASTLGSSFGNQDRRFFKPKKLKLGSIKARKNFSETAFFYPNLRTNAQGEIIVKFTVPEALTRWKMLGIAHTTDLKYGVVTNQLVTQKELMVEPNAPRYFREGDAMTFMSKIVNVSAKNLSGVVQLFLFDAVTNQPIDKLLGNNKGQLNFSAKAGQSTVVKWQLKIPKGVQAITYQVVAKAGNFSDGEEMTLPVLSNRMLVTETMPLPVRGKQTKTFELKKLTKTSQSKTLKHHRYTLEFTANPAWYAIQALPYLMEFPHECAEQTFSRYYANVLAAHVTNSNAEIKQVFDTWKNRQPDALLGNLEKNQELKSLILNETPWVRDAKNENERKHRVGKLFDLKRMANAANGALRKLINRQSSGSWAWFEGGIPSLYITQHIAIGMGHLAKLGIKDVRENEDTWDMTEDAIAYADKKMYDSHQAILLKVEKGKTKLSYDHLNYLIIQYLYMRSFFADVELDKKHRQAYNYYLKQVQKYWKKKSLYAQGILALVSSRKNNDVLAKTIVSSLRQCATNNEEMGMYWKQAKGYYWYQAPIETQALMVEVFAEVAKDTKAVNDLRTFLLKSKQTQDWKTTRATTDACYALLLGGNDWLSNKYVGITVGNHKINPYNEASLTKAEVGTGYFKKSWKAAEITPNMGKVTVSKKDKGVAWGAVYWQYFEQLDKITTAKTPLQLKKKLFLQKTTEAGVVLEPIGKNTKVKVGDLLKVRISLQVDRLMEYVHMKDMRAAGLEPIVTRSRYRWQNSLGYYQSTRDAATHFFFDTLPQGTYVFEYALRVSHAGDFSNGVTSIQCMYAPEFANRSEGVRLKFVEK